MRILFITYSDFATPFAVGGDYYIWELAKGLANYSNYVRFLCGNLEDSKNACEWSKQFTLQSSVTNFEKIFEEYVDRQET